LPGELADYDSNHVKPVWVFPNTFQGSKWSSLFRSSPALPFWKISMVEIDEILAAAIQAARLQINSLGSRSHHHIDVETARQVRVELEREGIIITPSRPLPEVRTSPGGSIPIKELNASTMGRRIVRSGSVPGGRISFYEAVGAPMG
jgi:hypothetical protein